jgi:dTDP-4-dehydrorhamnose reductase
MKLLIIGCNGMLGNDMVAEARKAGHVVFCIDHPEIDITIPDSVKSHAETLRPEAIVNCAAYTAVDQCETNRETAFAVNGAGAGNIARAASGIGAKLVHISTDYVFDGKAIKPYVEDDPTNPASVYGQSKLEGEKLVMKNCGQAYILRIAWLYGKNGNNFVKTIRSIGRKNAVEKKPLKVVNDQWGTPTWTKEVCRQILKLLETGHYGLYHATNEGRCTWFDFAKKIIASAGIPCEVLPCATKEFPRPAPRPAFSVLENRNLKRLGLNVMQDWEKAFEEFLRLE